MSDSSRSHGLQPTRLLHPWDFSGESTGVGCHCLLREISIPLLKKILKRCTSRRKMFPEEGMKEMVSRESAECVENVMNIVNNYTESLSEKGWLLHQLESCQQISFIYWPLQEGPQFKRSTLVKVKVKAKGAQSCPSLCDPMDYTVHGILQARILEWVTYPFSRRSSQPRNQTRVSCIAGRFFTN